MKFEIGCVIYFPIYVRGEKYAGKKSAADACVHAALLDCRVKKKVGPISLTKRAPEKNKKKKRLHDVL
jgi:hypothetical protein